MRWQEPPFRELYDRRRDPWQLTNVYDDRRHSRIRHLLQLHLVETLQDCAGRECRRRVPPLPRPTAPS
ncbi:hypothetical protein JCM10369A_36400 [Nocardioides pyridinolyticus]